jgi:hypothetical protein
MRNLNMNELVEVEGGKISAAVIAGIISFVSDAISLIDTAMKVDYESMVNNSAVDFGGVNAMGDYTNGMCSR